jgi:lipopolysaccharide biosynthesis glycosyltransferase
MEERGSALSCLVFAATERFLPGAVVAIASFLKHHPRFGGEIVLFHDGLPAGRCAAIERAFPRLSFRRVGAVLRERLARLGAARPDLGAKLAHFYRLEAFRIGGRGKVLYCDCDLLFRRPIDALFEAEGALLCCGDVASLHGGGYDAATYRPMENPSRAAAPGALERPFNSGLLLIDARLRGERTYSELLTLVSPETWRGTKAHFSDQLVLNRYFAGRQTLVPSTYNYRLHLAGDHRAQDGQRAAEARVLHFSGPVKPWAPEAMLGRTAGEVRLRPHPAFAYWYEAWVQSLASAYLRAAVRRLSEERRSAE